MRTLSMVCLAAALLVACGGKRAVPQAAPEAAAPEPVDDASRPVHERVNEAAALIEAADPAGLERAITLLEGAKAEASGPEVQFNLGLAYRALGRTNQARGVLEPLVREHPSIPEAWRVLGDIYELGGEWRAAERSYRTGTDHNPEHIGLRVALVANLRKQDRPDDAIAVAKDALKVNANAVPVYNNFALAYLDKGDTTLARFILNKALQGVEGAQTNPTLHTNLGWSYYLDGNRPAAVASLTHALELDPNQVPALVFLSRVYLEDRNFEDMVPLLETAKSLDPTNASVQLTLGIAYRGMNRLNDARAAYEQALVLDPENPDPHFNIGILLGDYDKDYDAAVAAFERYLDRGGTERDTAQSYIQAVTKEKERAERRARAEAARREREAERARKAKLIEETSGTDDGSAAAPPSEPAPKVDGTPTEGGSPPVEPQADDVPSDDEPEEAP